jgi:hypothetical protein
VTHDDTSPRPVRFLACGASIASAFLALARLSPRLGTGLHLALLALAATAYLVAVLQLFRGRVPGTRALVACLVLAFAARAPLVFRPAGTSDDSHRYLWDARVQRAGLNPYTVVPNDPAYAALHTPDTRLMNNPGVPSPYPPGAQLFFRLVTRLGESVVMFKSVLVACEVVTVFLLLAWLRQTGRASAWVLVYAWHPVAIFETASGAHLDALGTMFVVAAALALVRDRRLTATLALAAGISVKFVPVVLLPLLYRRVRWMHAAAGLGLLALLYAPFLVGWQVPPGSLGTFVDRFRFNQVLFEPVASVLGARGAAGLAGLAGIAAAAWLRARRRELEPDGWAWPVGAALLLAPVVYPWYLVWLLPFLVVRSTLPLLAWSLAIIPTYRVWDLARGGGPWAVPHGVLWIEYGLVAITALVVWLRSLPRRGPSTGPISGPDPAASP